MPPRFIFLIYLLALCERDAVGLAEGYVLDSQLTASSELNASTPARNGRLNYTAGSSWCASTTDSYPYLQIDLQTLYIICAVSTQGNSQGDQWVETYTLQSSTDGTAWTDYKEHGQSNIRVQYKYITVNHLSKTDTVDTRASCRLTGGSVLSKESRDSKISD